MQLLLVCDCEEFFYIVIPFLLFKTFYIHFKDIQCEDIKDLTNIPAVMWEVSTLISTAS